MEKWEDEEREAGWRQAGAPPDDGTAACLQAAVTHHRQNDLAQAERLYRDLLAMRPEDFDALHLLGVIALQRGEADTAVALIGRAIERNDGVPAAHSNLGLALRSLGRHKDALACFRRAVELKPGFTEAIVSQGLVYQDMARPQDALACFNEVVRCKPDCPVSQFNRGSVLQDLGRFEDALVAFDQAIRLRPDFAEAFNNRGNALRQLGRREEALDSFAQALRIRPDLPDVLSNCANLLREMGRLEEALRCAEEALRIKPDFIGALFNHASILHELARPAAALAAFDAVLRLDPAHALAHCNRAIALQDLGRHHEAVAGFEQALHLKPDMVEAWNNRANALKALDRPDEALASFTQGLRCKPDFVEILSNRGNLLRELQRPDEALADLERALALRPDFIDALINRGVALESLGRLEEAIDAYADVVRRKPDFVEALSNRGAALSALGRHDEAQASFAKALRIDPGHASAQWNESLCRLRRGDFEAGWEKYEWRWRTSLQEKFRRNLPQPLWLGQAPLDGKTILLHAEQGLGDTIQFCRYAKRVAAQGATVLLEVQAPLKALLSGLAGVSRTFAQGEALPPFDWHCPLLSLPLACGAPYAPMPAVPPYLAAAPDAVSRWESRWQSDWQQDRARRHEPAQASGGEPGRLRRVGLAWSGNPLHKGDRNRSIPLARLGGLLAPSMHFVSLQKDVRDTDREALKDFPRILRADGALQDFADTAALIATLDLVITVDTSIAHLAGAMGKPVWILLPFIADWRWQHQREDSPWYPSARLFRQAEFGQWESVIARVARELG